MRFGGGVGKAWQCDRKLVLFSLGKAVDGSENSVSTTVDGSEIPNHHLGCIKPYEYWDVYYINWCRISYINSTSS